MKTIAHFDANFLEPVYRFAGVNDIRHDINGINIKPAANGGVILSATDGYTAIMARDPSGYAFREVTISVDKALIRASKHKGAKAFVATSEGVGVITSVAMNGTKSVDGLIFSAKAVGKINKLEDKYPDLTKPSVIGGAKPETPSQFSINPVYLARLAGCFGAMQGKHGKANEHADYVSVIAGADRNSVVRFTPAYEGVEAMVAIMPVMHDCEPDLSLEWAKPLVKKRLQPGEKFTVETVAKENEQ